MHRVLHDVLGETLRVRGWTRTRRAFEYRLGAADLALIGIAHHPRPIDGVFNELRFECRIGIDRRGEGPGINLVALTSREVLAEIVKTRSEVIRSIEAEVGATPLLVDVPRYAALRYHASSWFPYRSLDHVSRWAMLVRNAFAPIEHRMRAMTPRRNNLGVIVPPAADAWWDSDLSAEQCEAPPWRDEGAP
jgi:hypothetical protein